MDGNIDVKRMERKAYISFHRDGLWDIFMGAFLFAWGLSMATEMAGMGGIWFVVLFPALMAAKRRITYPRLGYAEFPRARQAKTKLVIVFSITALLGLLVAIFWTGDILPGLRHWLQQCFAVFFGGLIAAILCIVAMVYVNRRLYAYAAIVLLAFACAQWLELNIRYSFLASGGVILLSGIVVLISFLYRYPIEREEAESAAKER